MHGISAKGLRRLSTAAFLAIAACGVGSKTVPVFVEGVVGPEGGQLEVEDALLVIPPGAFTEDKVCAIVPGPAGLPIDPGEGGSIDLLPDCKCFGPRGTPLLVDGFVRLCYDPNDIPLKTSESSLVLLEWDNVQGFLVVTPATQNLTTHCFEDPNYDELGYVVVGVRVGAPPPVLPDPDFVFFGGPTPPPVVAPTGLPSGGPGLVLADGLDFEDFPFTPQPLAGTDNASEYLPSSTGARVLFTRDNFQTEGTSLHTVDVDPVEPPSPREVLPEATWDRGDGLYGWLGTQDRVFHSHGTGSLGVAPQGVSPLFFSYRAGNGTGAVVDFDSVTKSAFTTYLNDVRVSPDRSMVLLRWTDFSDGYTSIVDVIDATDGTPIGLDIPVYVDPFANANLTPKWMPDSSGIYFIEFDGVTVTKVDPDGNNSTTLYTLAVPSAPNSVLLDFVVAPPSGLPEQRCAFIRRDNDQVVSGQVFGQGGGPDSYDTDTLAGTDFTTLDLGDFVTVEEMVADFSAGAFEAPYVLVQMSVGGRFGGPVDGLATLPTLPDGHTLVFDLTGATLRADLPVPLSSLDISRAQESLAHVLLWIEFVDQTYPEYPSPGLYELLPDFTKPTDVTPLGWTAFGPPRWLNSWRTAPGFRPFFTRVR